MKNLLGYFIRPLIIVCVATLFVSCKEKQNKDKDIEDGLVITAKQLNDKAPFMIDQVTRIDSTVVKNKEMISYYSILADTKGVDKNTIKDVLIKSMRTNPETAALSESDVKFTFIYRDSIGRHFYTTSIQSPDLK